MKTGLGKKRRMGDRAQASGEKFTSRHDTATSGHTATINPSGTTCDCRPEDATRCWCSEIVLSVKDLLESGALLGLGLQLAALHAVHIPQASVREHFAGREELGVFADIGVVLHHERTNRLSVGV